MKLPREGVRWKNMIFKIGYFEGFIKKWKIYMEKYSRMFFESSCDTNFVNKTLFLKDGQRGKRWILFSNKHGTKTN